MTLLDLFIEASKHRYTHPKVDEFLVAFSRVLQRKVEGSGEAFLGAMKTSQTNSFSWNATIEDAEYLGLDNLSLQDLICRLFSWGTFSDHSDFNWIVLQGQMEVSYLKDFEVSTSTEVKKRIKL